MTETCKLTMQPQDNYVRELEVVFRDGTHKILTDETYPAKPGELPMSWTFEGIDQILWAKGGNEYADHYIVKDCALYDAETGTPGYHGETPYWRASITLERVSVPVNNSTTTFGTPSTIVTGSTVPELVTSTTRPILTLPVTELPFTGVDAGFLFTVAMLTIGVGYMLRAYVQNFKEHRAKQKHSN